MTGPTGRRALAIVQAFGLAIGASTAAWVDQLPPQYPYPTFPQPGSDAREPRVKRDWDTAVLEQWLTAAELHDPGSVDGTLASAVAWSGEDLRKLWIDVQLVLQIAANPNRSRLTIRTLGSVARPASGGRTRMSFGKDQRAALEKTAARVRGRGVNLVVRRAAVLHTDIVTLGASNATPTGTANAGVPGAPFRMLISDGATLGVDGVSLHWEMARLVLSHVTPDPTRDTFVRDWYRATVAMGHSGELFDVPHLSAGLRLFPGDPELLLLAGAEREAMATPMFQAFARSLRTTTMRTGIGAADEELSAAERFYRRALEANAQLAEARVRLGRVLTLQGHHADAVRELRLASGGSLDPLLKYYAALFLGTALEGVGELDAARQALRLAAAIVPASRAPHLTLARIARELGDREETTAGLDRALAPLTGNDADPIWTYRASAGLRRATWLDDVRQAVKADRP